MRDAVIEGGKKPKTSILMKIFLNYLQLVSIVASFEFKWPDEVEELFSYQNKVAESTSQVFSIDCFFPETDKESKFKPFFIKLTFISLSPFIIIAISYVVWLVVSKYYSIKNKKPIDWIRFKSNLITTSVVMVFMIHTTLVQTAILGGR